MSIYSPPLPLYSRVLVIDDNRDAAEMLSALIVMLGHDGRYALDGPAGVFQAELFKPDVIFLDIGMPGMDGFEVCIALRSIEALTFTRIIALTASAEPETRRKCKAVGFDFHLAKPASIDLIESMIIQSGFRDGTVPAELRRAFLT